MDAWEPLVVLGAVVGIHCTDQTPRIDKFIIDRCVKKEYCLYLIMSMRYVYNLCSYASSEIDEKIKTNSIMPILTYVAQI